MCVLHRLKYGKTLVVCVGAGGADVTGGGGSRGAGRENLSGMSRLVCVCVCVCGILAKHGNTREMS